MRPKLIAGFLGCLFTAGCSSSDSQPDVVETTNRAISRAEKSTVPLIPMEERIRMAKMYPDRPDYAALVLRDSDNRQFPRLKTSVAPAYPREARGSKSVALVKVGFIISESGDVEDARIYESSDARFSEPALTAVRAWTFFPGFVDGFRTKYFTVVPFEFGE